MRTFLALIVIASVASGPAMAQQLQTQNNALIGTLTKAVERGNPGAALQLGFVYAYGSNGVPVDYVRAYMWLEIWEDAIKTQIGAGSHYGFRERIEMTSAQIAEARRLAGEWRSKHPESRSATAAAPQSTPLIPLLQPLPPYTDAAQKAGVEGDVLLQCIIRKDATIDSFKVIKTLGYGMTESAINTILSQWKYVPATVNGVPVDTQTSIEIPFRLPKGNK
jgi:TonB family protein